MTATEFDDILKNNILPFWTDRMVDLEHGGFYGRIDGHNVLYPQAPKGAVLHARILWTFSAAYRFYGDSGYRATAERAFEYLATYFVDEVHGGVYWEIDYTGRPSNRKKQLYAQAFALYGFSEYYRATGDAGALEKSKAIFDLIESTADQQHGGYPEAFAENWQPIADMRLSDKDANEKKSMNTHLHILEAYTNLYTVWNDPSVEKALRQLIGLFSTRILNPETSHLHLFFAEDWEVKSSAVSYGHDIEASWLLREATSVLDDPRLLKEAETVSLQIAGAATAGLQTDGSLAYEEQDGHLDRDRHWWVQAEAVVGFAHAYHHSGDTVFRDHATRAWAYIRAQLIDFQNGEWHWSRRADGTIDYSQDKAGLWKCPYHNGRMCIMLSSFLKGNTKSR